MLPGPDALYLIVAGNALWLVVGDWLGRRREYRRWVAAHTELYRWPRRRGAK